MTPVSHARRTTAVAAVLLAVLAGLTACGKAFGGGGGDGEEQTTIRYQSYAGAVDILLVADALGELDGLELERVGDITGGPQSLQALVSDQVDISGSAFYGAIAQLVSTGAPIKAVVPSYGSNDKTNQKLVVKSGSGIEGPRDLIGKKIAVNTLGAHAEAMLDTWFEREGLSEEEQDRITLVPLPPLNTPEALEQGQVDAAVVGFLSYETMRAQFGVDQLVNDIEIVGEPYVGGALSLRTQFIEDNPETSRQLVEGVSAAIEFIETHSKEEVFDLYFPYLEEEGFADYIPAIEANFPGTTGVPADAVVTDADIERWVSWLEGRGELQGDLTIGDVYTNELNPNA